MNTNEELMVELRDILQYAIENRCWMSVDEAHEMICEELGMEPFASDDEELEDY